MPKSPSTPSSTNHEAPKGSSLRDKILLVLSGFALGALVAGAVLKKSSNNDSPKEPEITDVSKNEDGGSDNKKGAFLPPASSSYSTNSKKGAFVPPTRSPFTANGHGLMCEPPSDEEIEDRAHAIETKKLVAIAQDILKKFCITNQDDREAILRTVLEGYSNSDDEYIEGNDSDGWSINLEKTVESEGASASIGKEVELNERPPCKSFLKGVLEVDEDEEEIEKKEEEAEAMSERIKNNQFHGLLGSISVDQVRNEVIREGLEDGLGGDLIDMLRKVEDGRKLGEMDATQRKLFACKLDSFVMNSSEGVGLDEKPATLSQKEAIQKMESNKTIKNAIEKLLYISQALLGETDSFRCFLNMYKM